MIVSKFARQSRKRNGRLRRKKLGDFSRILAPRRFASDDNRPRIDVLPRQSRFLERRIHERLQRCRLDIPIAGKWCEQNRRARNHPALQYHEPP